jgi:hypothetical protein
MNDCFAELERLLSPEDLKQLKESTAENLNLYHFGLGLWMRNYWGLWSGSRLQKYFLELGFTEPDAMSGVIINCFWLHLNHRPIRLEEMAETERYYNRIRQEPTDRTCPEHRVPLKLTYELFGATTKEGKSLPREVYVAHCSQGSEIGVHEYEQGWYKPEGDLRQRIEELEQIDELAAQESGSRSTESEHMHIAPLVNEPEARGSGFLSPVEEYGPKEE